jgi:hypothetical protein
MNLELDEPLMVLVLFGTGVVGVLIFFLSSPRRSPWRRRPLCPSCGRIGTLALMRNDAEDSTNTQTRGQRIRIYCCGRCGAREATRVMDPEDA